jgi:hypothetical protein
MDTELTIKLNHTRQRIEATDPDMSGSTFADVNLTNTTFNDVNLSGAQIENACLSGLRLSDVNLTGASIVDSRTDGMTIDGIAVSDLWTAYHADPAAEEHGFGASCWNCLPLRKGTGSPASKRYGPKSLPAANKDAPAISWCISHLELMT